MSTSEVLGKGCKRPECQAINGCAHMDEAGNSWCFGDVRLTNKKWVSDAYDAELVRRFQSGLPLSRIDRQTARKLIKDASHV